MSPELLADENVDARIIEHLRSAGYCVLEVSKLAQGSSDAEVLRLAREHSTVLLTEDSDFGELVFAHKIPALGVVFLRYSHTQRLEITQALLTVLRVRASTLSGAFTVVTTTKVRSRTL